MDRLPVDLQNIIYRYIHKLQYREVMEEFHDCVKWCVRHVPKQSHNAFCLNIPKMKDRPRRHDIFEFLPNNLLYII